MSKTNGHRKLSADQTGKDAWFWHRTSVLSITQTALSAVTLFFSVCLLLSTYRYNRPLAALPAAVTALCFSTAIIGLVTVKHKEARRTLLLSHHVLCIICAILLAVLVLAASCFGVLATVVRGPYYYIDPASALPIGAAVLIVVAQLVCFVLATRAHCRQYGCCQTAPATPGQHVLAIDAAGDTKKVFALPVANGV